MCLRPDYETATHWGQWWANDQVLAYAKTLGVDAIDLYGDADIEPNFDIVLGRNPGAFICGMGHGNETTIVGQNESVLLDTRASGDLSLMRDKSGSFLSCSFGVAGDAFTRAGMLAFYGYNRTYWFMIGTYPNGTASPFYLSHYAFDRAILEGHTFMEAFNIAHTAYDVAISGSWEDAARYLIYDRDSMVIWGDPKYAPYGKQEPPPDEPPPDEPPPDEPPDGKLKCPWGDYETMDPETLKNHIVAAHCPGCAQRPLWCQWFGSLVGCPLP